MARNAKIGAQSTRRPPVPEEGTVTATFLHRATRKHRQEDDVRREFEEAALDPEFMRDIHDTMATFASADVETARLIPEWSTAASAARPNPHNGDV